MPLGSHAWKGDHQNVFVQGLTKMWDKPPFHGVNVESTGTPNLNFSIDTGEGLGHVWACPKRFYQKLSR